MKTIAKIIAAIIVAAIVGVIAIALDASDNFVLGVYFVVALSLSALMGVFDIPEERKNSIRKNNAERSDMRDAA